MFSKSCNGQLVHLSSSCTRTTKSEYVLFGKH